MFGLLPFDGEDNSLLNILNDIARNINTDIYNFMPSLATNVKDSGEKYIMEIDVTGYTKDDVSIVVNDNLLTVNANHNENSNYAMGNFYHYQRQLGSLTRSYDISTIKANEITVDFRDGKLILDLPKKDIKLLK